MKKIIIYIVLFMFGIITFPVFLFLNWKNKDKNYKNYLVASGVGFAFYLIGIVFGEDPETQTNTQVAENEETVQPIDNATTENTVKDPVETKDEQPEEESTQDIDAVPEENLEKQNESGNDTDTDKGDEGGQEEEEIEEVPFEYLDNGIALVELDESGAWSINGAPALFAYEGAKIIKEHYDQFDNGIILANVNTLVDQYGNEEDTYTMAVHYSPDTIEKINFENWPVLDAEDLFKTADSVFIHYVIDNEDYRGYAGIQEDAPSAFYNYMGGAAE